MQFWVSLFVDVLVSFIINSLDSVTDSLKAHSTAFDTVKITPNAALQVCNLCQG